MNQKRVYRGLIILGINLGCITIFNEAPDQQKIDVYFLMSSNKKLPVQYLIKGILLHRLAFLRVWVKCFATLN